MHFVPFLLYEHSHGDDELQLSPTEHAALVRLLRALVRRHVLPAMQDAEEAAEAAGRACAATVAVAPSENSKQGRRGRRPRPKLKKQRKLNNWT